MSDDELDEPLRELIRDYHRPVETPREAMWREIARRRAEARRSRPLLIRRWMPLAAAALLLLAAGIGIGRLSGPDGTIAVSAPPAAVAAPEVNATAYELATLEHLSQAEEFLTLFRSSVGGEQRHASTAARRLLGTNRMLLDSPAAMDRRTRLLLEDLELVLAGIAQLPERARTEDLDLINQGMETGQVMPRLRTAVPSGAATRQGAL
ncbi:MAG TPA: hypothetical protein VEB59_06180 [Gemmatimonadales bacterium]|nr:hypothetical protein [Gemmatimonadales bacterium]